MHGRLFLWRGWYSSAWHSWVEANTAQRRLDRNALRSMNGSTRRHKLLAVRLWARRTRLEKRCGGKRHLVELKRAGKALRAWGVEHRAATALQNVIVKGTSMWNNQAASEAFLVWCSVYAELETSQVKFRTARRIFMRGWVWGAWSRWYGSAQASRRHKYTLRRCAAGFAAKQGHEGLRTWRNAVAQKIRRLESARGAAMWFLSNKVPNREGAT